MERMIRFELLSHCKPLQNDEFKGGSDPLQLWKTIVLKVVDVDDVGPWDEEMSPTLRRCPRMVEL